MTTLFSHASTSSGIVTEVSETASNITPQVQRQVDRLASTLASRDSAQTPRCILFVEIGESNNSSLWLAAAVAAVLGSKIKHNVHVLSLEASDKRRGPHTKPWLRFPGSRNFTLEQIENLYANCDGTETITERIASLRAAHQPVIVHLGHNESLADLLPVAPEIDGVVLLVRASRARRAALLAIEDQLAAAQIKLLGTVLLDRTYPIPNSLYRLL